MKTETEEWRDIKGYEGYYQVSNMGRVKSLERKIKRSRCGDATIKSKILKLWDTKDYYPYAHLCVCNKRKLIKIHRVIAETFIPNPENKPCINHINGKKNDNRVENLEWCTYSENNFHAFRMGLNNNAKGEMSVNSKLKDDDIIEIKRLYFIEKKSLLEVSLKYGVCKGTIDEIIRCRNWKQIKTPYDHLLGTPENSRSARNSKPILQLSEDGEILKEYKSQIEASSQTRINNGRIRYALRNPMKSTNGFRWKYKTQDI